MTGAAVVADATASVTACDGAATGAVTVTGADAGADADGGTNAFARVLQSRLRNASTLADACTLLTGADAGADAEEGVVVVPVSVVVVVAVLMGHSARLSQSFFFL